MSNERDNIGKPTPNEDKDKHIVKGRTDIAQGGTSGGMGSVGQQSDDPEIEDAGKEGRTSTHPDERGSTSHQRGGAATDGGAGS
jgi:hypothetical protein